MSLYGLMAAFADPEALIDAARGMRERGYRRMDAFSPFPLEELDGILEIPKTRLPWAVLVGGITCAALVYALIWYSVEVDYPINVGGRPLHSWPPFVVIAFEAGILGAAFAGFLGVLVANGLPRYYHPVFNAESFTYARGGRFYLLIEATDPKYRKSVTKRQLTRLGAEIVEEIEA
ncbi:DUF3341 domain-containing protein [Mesorhizobium sp. WSM3224]|jgi:hypothetical protein|uniref:DUF3341 domain-containing protein n=1 Tax=Mesorhizobium sp. WSM3224 TaxID=1040986 RepID=UPI0004257696|nr:DUF3341 domain-containing protein [Mesorhizobium sp. WSM3224]